MQKNAEWEKRTRQSIKNVRDRPCLSYSTAKWGKTEQFFITEKKWPDCPRWIGGGKKKDGSKKGNKKGQLWRHIRRLKKTKM